MGQRRGSKPRQARHGSAIHSAPGLLSIATLTVSLGNGCPPIYCVLRDRVPIKTEGTTVPLPLHKYKHPLTGTSTDDGMFLAKTAFKRHQILSVCVLFKIFELFEIL
jgi:hypothetical protein